MRQHQEELRVATNGRGLIELTAEVRDVLRRAEIATGQVTVFCQHTSASLVIQENADPSASADLLAWLARLAPDGDRAYTHTAEGPDDMPSHLRSAVTRTAETIPVVEGELALGTWQGLFLLEHRDVAHTRNVVVHVLGE
jgi:secondary thiamine-phosphate synthase enzyme